jgi:MoxR-like ATPase
MTGVIEVKNISDKITENISKVIIGKDKEIKLVLTAIFAGGHIIIEDKPGTGKTTMAKALAKSIAGDFKRIQFTPDLMPADVTGLNIYNRQTSAFELVKGPVFTHILLADEINRATPRTQSSLLEVMEERQVTIDGTTYELEQPFIVLATENPVETAGTYPLPEAQLDRFMMKISMGENNKEDELAIVDRYINSIPLEEISAICSTYDIMACATEIKNVYVHKCIREYAIDIIMATRNNSRITMGASTRGALALIRCGQSMAAIEGRDYVKPDDIRGVAPYVLGHRIITAGHFRDKKESNIIEEIVNSVKVPVENWESR